MRRNAGPGLGEMNLPPIGLYNVESCTHADTAAGAISACATDTAPGAACQGLLPRGGTPRRFRPQDPVATGSLKSRLETGFLLSPFRRRGQERISVLDGVGDRQNSRVLPTWDCIRGWGLREFKWWVWGEGCVDSVNGAVRCRGTGDM